jgi:hypothetical protein
MMPSPFVPTSVFQLWFASQFHSCQELSSWISVSFFFFLLLCWVGVHCGIYKSFYNVKYIIIKFTPSTILYPPFLIWISYVCDFMLLVINIWNRYTSNSKLNKVDTPFIIWFTYIIVFNLLLKVLKKSRIISPFIYF